MVETTRIFASHVGQRRASKPKVRFMRTCQSTREDAAKSSPSRMRFQCFTGMLVGASSATGMACAAELAFEAARDTAGASVVFCAGQGFDVTRLVKPAGGFGVTSLRHEERAAKTPYSERAGNKVVARGWPNGRRFHERHD